MGTLSYPTMPPRRLGTSGSVTRGLGNYNPRPLVMTRPPLFFIGDRPAQILAIVHNASNDLRYTGDKLGPYQVLDRVEQYIEDHSKDAGYLTSQRRIVLSTGITWGQRYDGIVAKQINKLLAGSFVHPIVYVLPVSDRLLTSVAVNAKLNGICIRTGLKQQVTRFLGTYVSFEGEIAYPSQPTPVEALRILDLIEGTVLVDPP